jgi:hypothetical protein
VVIHVRCMVCLGNSIVTISYLELVLAGLGSRRGVQEINGENLGNKPLAMLSFHQECL